MILSPLTAGPGPVKVTMHEVNSKCFYLPGSLECTYWNTFFWIEFRTFYNTFNCDEVVVLLWTSVFCALVIGWCKSLRVLLKIGEKWTGKYKILLNNVAKLCVCACVAAHHWLLISWLASLGVLYGSQSFYMFHNIVQPVAHWHSPGKQRQKLKPQSNFNQLLLQMHI